MNTTKAVIVTSRDGAHGTIDPAYHQMDGSQSHVLVAMDQGPRLWVPFELLQVQADGSYYLPVSISSLHGETEMRLESHEETVLPVIAEKLNIQRRVVQTGKGLRLVKKIRQRQETIDEPTYVDKVNVVRVTVDQVLDEPREIRHEGDTIIVPVMEEVLVVEKRLMLREEVRITRVRQVERNPQQVTLREEEVAVEQLDSRAS